ncbi:YciI family protein [Nonomuraea rubra]|nr:YciI family protein [Nonomuraea rubra]
MRRLGRGNKDQIGGFSLIEAADLDEAVAIAAAHPVARYGSIEVRPVLEP